MFRPICSEHAPLPIYMAEVGGVDGSGKYTCKTCLCSPETSGTLAFALRVAGRRNRLGQTTTFASTSPPKHPELVIVIGKCAVMRQGNSLSTDHALDRRIETYNGGLRSLRCEKIQTAPPLLHAGRLQHPIPDQHAWEKSLISCSMMLLDVSRPGPALSQNDASIRDSFCDLSQTQAAPSERFRAGPQRVICKMDLILTWAPATPTNLFGKI
jgi:hypothetical protein